MTAVMWQFNELQKIEKALENKVIDGIEFTRMKYEIHEKSKEMEEQAKVEFAFRAYSEMLSGKSFIDVVNSMRTFKSE